MPTIRRRRVVVDDRSLADAVGGRLRALRKNAGFTQQQLAGERYTKAYISALENGLAKPSVAALSYLAARLGVDPSVILSDPGPRWTRLEAELRTAAGDFETAADAYEQLLSLERTHDERAGLLLGLAETYASLDRPSAAITAAAEAVDLFAKSGRDAEAAMAGYWLAYAHFLAEQVGQARSILEDILARVRGGLSVAPDFRLRLLMALSSTASRQGMHDAALGYLAEVRGLAEQLDDRRRATYLFDLALNYRETGDYEAAVRAGNASLTLFRAIDSEAEMGAMENELAMSFLVVGNLDRARELAQAARSRFERLDDARWISHVSDTEARIALAGGDTERAMERATNALERAVAIGSGPAEVDALTSMAAAHAARGETDLALGMYERAASRAREIDRPRRLREVLTEWSDLLAVEGRTDEALVVAREALHAGG
ncbi:MAG: tetratricopeptide repeat protein [Candidatus Limnocylindrales bacterium]